EKKSLRQRRGGTSGLEAFACPAFLVPADPETWTGALRRGCFSAGSAAPYRAEDTSAPGTYLRRCALSGPWYCEDGGGPSTEGRPPEHCDLRGCMHPLY
ncbi:hypothetical protein J1605_010339, partial [Eschrichtius robustus]